MTKDAAVSTAHLERDHLAGEMESPLNRRRNSVIEASVYCAIILFVILGVWLPLLRTSFVIDETGTVWAISGGLRQIIHRSLHFPQSIAYCFTAWGAAQIGGTREVALRLPSLLAGLGAMLLLYKLVARVVDKTTAILACLLWILLPVVTAEATAARPYAFGALAIIASFWALIAWLESPSTNRFLRYAILGALPAYFSYFFVLVPATQILYLVLARKSWNLRFKSVRWLAMIIGFVELPLLYPVMLVAKNSALHTYLHTPALSSLVYTLIPNALAYGLLTGIGIYLTLGIVWKYHPAMVSGKYWLLIVLWTAVPVVAMLALSLFTPVKCFAERYFFESFAGLAIALAVLLRGFHPARLRVAVTLATAVFAIGGLGQGRSLWHMQRFGDYRGASRFLANYRRANVLPTFTISGFVEAGRLPFPLSTEDESCLTAPLLAYPAGGPVGLLPPFETKGTDAYIKTERAFFDTTSRDFLMYLDAPDDLPNWVAEAVRRRFETQVLYTSLDVAVVRFHLRTAGTRE